MRRYNYKKQESNPLEQLIKNKENKPVRPKVSIVHPKPVSPPPPVQKDGMKLLVKDSLDSKSFYENTPKKKQVETISKPVYDENFYKNWWENSLENQTISSSFALKYICSLQLDDFSELKWVHRLPKFEQLPENDSFESQMDTLIVLVTYLNELGFPKIEKESLLLKIFKEFLAKGIIQDEIFTEWYQLQENFPKALIQSSEWILQLMEKIQNEENEENDEFETI